MASNLFADNRFESTEIMETIGPCVVLRDDINRHMYLQPTAIMLPLSLYPDIEAVFGLPVYRGDRVALIYEPPKAY